MFTKVASALLVVSLSSMSAVAAPDGSDEAVPTRIVHFADLNINNAAGAAELYGRIRTAAREVCRPGPGSELYQRSAARQCRDQATKRAVADVNAPKLNEVYEVKAKPSFDFAQR